MCVSGHSHDSPSRSSSLMHRTPQASNQDSDGVMTAERFAALYQQAFGWLCLVAATQIGRAEADDVVQQAAIIAMKRLSDFQPGTNFHAWMATIVRNAAKNQARSNRRRKRRERATAADRVRYEQQASVESKFSSMDVKLRDAVNELEEGQRSCLLMRTAYGLSYAEISVALDVPEATARSHVFRARKHLLAKIGSEAQKETPA